MALISTFSNKQFSARRRLAVACLAAGLALAGCGRSASETAGGLAPRTGQATLIAKADERGFASNTGRVQVTAVDDVKRTTGRGTFGLTNRLAIAAGPHTVAFVYNVSYGCQVIGCKTKGYEGKVRFMAEAGRSYQLHAAISPTEELWAWVVDETDGRIVAGRLPPGS
jgi:hypothetical protein